MWTKPVMKPPFALADCIFVEHRGFGLSRPSLDCPGSYDLALDEPGNPDSYRDAHCQYLTNAVSFWQEQGVDIAGYNAREMAADIDDLRQALGYERLSIYGGSFGSHHGFALLRYYGQTIERAFLWDVEGPNHTIKLPSNIQKQLVKLDSLLREDSILNSQIPDLLELMASVLDRLKQQSVIVETIHPQSEEKVNITIGAYDLQLVTANGLGNVPFLRALPIRYLDMASGDYSWLAEQVIRVRVNQKSNIMYEATDIASGATTKRWEQIAREAPDTLLGDVINEPFHALGDVLGNPDLGDEFRGKLVSDVPIILVGGSVDARTPISNAQELLPDLSRGRLITVEGASHDIAFRGNHCKDMAHCRDRFFQGEEPDSSELNAGFTFHSHKREIQ
jgi:pimeloyl-ACP methyl ester carboxylesterase